MGRAVTAGVMTALVLSTALFCRPGGPAPDSLKLSAAGTPAKSFAPEKAAASEKAKPAAARTGTVRYGGGRLVHAASRTRFRARPAFPKQPVAGLDTCSAPSLGALRAWKRRASVIAVYVGGGNRACANRNLSASWVRHAWADGWHLVPVYVGLQPSCDRFRRRIKPPYAASEGSAAADDAMTQAGRLGIRRGAPLYADMESYNSRNVTCRIGVLTFLDAWTRQLHAHGYVSGVYAGAGSGASYLASTTSVAGHALAKPDSIWVAYWDGKENLTAGRYLPGSAWSGRRRIKQYRGPHWETHGNVRLNIDSDWVYGRVY